MIDEVTGNKVVECPLGMYDVVTHSFLIVEHVSDLTLLDTDKDFVMVINHGDGIRDNETYKILYEFTAQDIADALSIHAKNIGEQYAEMETI